MRPSEHRSRSASVTTEGSLSPDSTNLRVAKTALAPSVVAGDVQGFRIEIVKEGEEINKTMAEYEIDLNEFIPEFGEDLINSLLNAGFHTANDVILASVSDLLAKVPGISIEKINEIVVEMKKAFTEEEE